MTTIKTIRGIMLASVLGLVLWGGIVAIGVALAQQPSLDSVDIDEVDCLVTVEWIDGTDDTETIEVFVNDVRIANLVINDVVGNQGRIVAEFEAEEDDEVLAVLTANGGEDEYSQTLTVGSCPVVATSTPTSTATPTSTSTPVPTSTPAPTQTPIVIFVPAATVVPVAPTAVPVVTTSTVRPPSTGDGGLLQ